MSLSVKAIGQRSKVKGQGHEEKNALCTPIVPRQRTNGPFCCMTHRNALAADGTIPSLPWGVISVACVRFIFD